jgi:prefoldin subunit 5
MALILADCPHKRSHTVRVPTDVEDLAVRLARIKSLIETLDSVIGRTDEQEAAFRKLKQEISAIRESLKLVT